MSETMSHVERVLWRIAELGARCSQQAATGERAALWAELEQTIAGLDHEFEAAGQAADTAPEQVRSLEGRLKVAVTERDREKAKLREYKADADAARRERDRALDKARKAIAVATEAKAATLEARSTAAECVARASAAENSVKKAMAARAEAIAARNEALKARDHAVSDRNKAVNALADALTAGERAADVRDQALADRDTAVRALEAAQARIAELEAAAAKAAEQDAVVVLPGVTVPEPHVGPITAGNRVSWAPTWSEWARPGADDTAPVVDVTTAGEEIRLDDAGAVEESGACRYLNVAATINGLLPDDLGPYLQPGASVVRREGRLFAIVAISARASEPDAETAQVQRFVDAGFKVEWAPATPLGV